jgi:tRNA threonylcarbamoyladenosine biosynthesis protein TsaE
MDNKFQLELSIGSIKATQELAESIGRKLRGGEVIQLISDVGGGKTTLVKGIVKGAGSKDLVSSPSFTIRNDYRFKDMTIAHFDFYRLNDPGILQNMLAEEIANPKTVVIIEWAKIVDDLLPADHVALTIHTMGLTSRRISINSHEKFSYLFVGVEK